MRISPRIWAIFTLNIKNPAPLPPHAIIYFETLHAEYGILPAGPVPPDVKPVIDEILKRKSEGSLSWRDIYTFDLTLTKLQPLVQLRRKIWSLRSRYREVAGLRDYEAYIATKPPEIEASQDPNMPAQEEVLRADAAFLLRELYLRYAMAPMREAIREKLSSWVWWITVIAMVLVIAGTLIASFQSASASMSGAVASFRPSSLLIVVFSGIMGGLVSVQQRFQNFRQEGDPVYNVSELVHGSNSIYLSPLSGAVFALLLYLLVFGGLLGGNLFPELNAPGETKVQFFVDFLRYQGPATFAGYSKLIVWSFIAGFAERLVPDTLTRLVEKAQPSQGASV